MEVCVLPFLHKSVQFCLCYGDDAAVSWMEIHVDGTVGETEMTEVCGFREMVLSFHVDVVHEYVFVLSDEAESARTLYGFRGQLLVAGFFCSAS